MKIGIVSDIHGFLCEAAHAALSSCDLILCAGDTERESVLMELEAIAPTIAVMGNCDRRSCGFDLPYTASPRIGGVRFFITHRPEDIGAPADDVAVIVHGHTHVPRNETIDGIRYVNPGSATHPRGGSKRSIAVLSIEEGAVRSVEFVEFSDL